MAAPASGGARNTANQLRASGWPIVVIETNVKQSCLRLCQRFEECSQQAFLYLYSNEASEQVPLDSVSSGAFLQNAPAMC